MTDKIRNLLEDVQTVYEGKGMVVHPNSFDRLRTEIIKLDNINKQQREQIEKMKKYLDCDCCEYQNDKDECHQCNFMTKTKWTLKKEIKENG